MTLCTLGDKYQPGPMFIEWMLLSCNSTRFRVEPYNQLRCNGRPRPLGKVLVAYTKGHR